MSLITYLTKIHFADDVLDEALRAETVALGIGRPLIVADRDAVATGLVQRTLDGLARAADALLFECGHELPTEADCSAAAAAYGGHACDGMIAVGGAGAIDLAKACGILVSHDGPLARYAAIEGGIARIRNRLPPIVAVPTRAGRGSEVGWSAAIRFEEGGKRELVSAFLIPRVAICDPTLTLRQSPEVTAVAGMDALTHCIEAFSATAFNPPADAIALDGARRIAKNLRRAVDRGSDLDARREIMAAALNGALAFQKGLGGVHAMSHALESQEDLNLDHGTLNAVLLPHVLEFNAPAVARRYDDLRSVLAGGATAGLPEAIRAFSAGIGLPARLGQMGVGLAAVRAAAPMAAKDHASSTNPRRAGADDYLRLMSAAL